VRVRVPLSVPKMQGVKPDTLYLAYKSIKLVSVWKMTYKACIQRGDAIETALDYAESAVEAAVLRAVRAEAQAVRKAPGK
jgi:hypothetical protein